MAQITRTDIVGKPRRKFLPAMPISISCFNLQTKVELETSEGSSLFRFQPGEESGVNPWGNDSPLDDVDAYLVRDTFFAVTNEVEALAFLRATGAFEVSNAHQRETGWIHTLTWARFKAWQDTARWVQVNGFLLDDLLSERGPLIVSAPDWLLEVHKSASEDLQAWLDGVPAFIEPATERNEKGQAVLELHVGAYTAMEAVIASLYVDRWSGVEYRLCELAGCGKIFSMEGQRSDKRHCCTAHAHHASVRRKRDDLKQKRKAKEGSHGKG